MKLGGQLYFLQQNELSRVRHLPCRDARRPVHGRQHARKGTHASAGTALRCGRPRAGQPPSSKACGARTAQVHRRAIDGAVAGRPFNPQPTAEREDLARGGYSSGFLERLSGAAPVAGLPERRNRPLAHATQPVRGPSQSRAGRPGGGGADEPLGCRRLGPSPSTPAATALCAWSASRTPTAKRSTWPAGNPLPARTPWTARPITR